MVCLQRLPDCWASQKITVVAAVEKFVPWLTASISWLSRSTPHCPSPPHKCAGPILAESIARSINQCKDLDFGVFGLSSIPQSLAWVSKDRVIFALVVILYLASVSSTKHASEDVVIIIIITLNNIHDGQHGAGSTRLFGAPGDRHLRRPPL
jgi:hypothetical protein